MHKNTKTWIFRGGILLSVLFLLLGMHLGNVSAVVAAPDFVASNIRMLNVDGGNYIFVQVKNIGTAGIASTVGLKPLAVSLNIDNGSAVTGYLQESAFPLGYAKELKFGPFKDLSATQNSSCTSQLNGDGCKFQETQDSTGLVRNVTCNDGWTLVNASTNCGSVCHGENHCITSCSKAIANGCQAVYAVGDTSYWIDCSVTCQKKSLYGKYALTAKVDTQNSYAEINEGNNTLIKTVVMPKPDFAVTNTRLTNENGSYYAYASIKNYGGGVAASGKPLWVDVTIPGKTAKSVSLNNPFYNNAYTKELKIGPLDDISETTSISTCRTHGSSSTGCTISGTGDIATCDSGYTLTDIATNCGVACHGDSHCITSCSKAIANGCQAVYAMGDTSYWIDCSVTCQKNTPADNISATSMIDGNNYFEESTEANNKMTKTLSVPKPDFTASNIRLTNENGLNYIRATIANTGEGTSASMIGGLKRLVICASSLGGASSIGDMPYLNTGVESISGVRESKYCTSAYESFYNKGYKVDLRMGPINGKLSDFLGTTSTIASVTVMADADSLFRETNETNNKVTSKIGIPIPDFTVGAIEIKQEGADYYAYAEIKNIGGGVSGMNGTAVKPLPITLLAAGGMWNFNYMATYYNSGFVNKTRFGPITKNISNLNYVSIKVMVDPNRMYTDKNYANNAVTKSVYKPPMTVVIPR